MGRNHLCEQAIPKDPAHLLPEPCGSGRPSGLSFGFPKLSPSRRQLDYVLLARPPLYSPCGFRVRLACLIHAANVRSEPGSNPSLGMVVLIASHHFPRSTVVPRVSGIAAHKPVRKPAARSAQKSSHAFFRGHPECQRSPRSPTFAGLRGAGEGSERRVSSQASAPRFFGAAASCF